MGFDECLEEFCKDWKPDTILRFRERVEQLLQESMAKFQKLDEHMQQRLAELNESMQWFSETTELHALIKGPRVVKIFAAEYLRFLLGNPPRPGFKGPKASSSYYHRFLSLMAKENGKSMEDTARLCGRIISAGDEVESATFPGSCMFLQAAQRHDKATLLVMVKMCRGILTFPRVAAELPDQVALLVHAKILDEWL